MRIWENEIIVHTLTCFRAVFFLSEFPQTLEYLNPDSSA